MANPEGIIEYMLAVAPKENVKQESGKRGSTWADVRIASTLAHTPQGCYYTSETVEYEDTGGIDDGYLNGAPVYGQATIAASVATITGLTNVEFILIKHTGFRYSSTSALSATANTTDHLCVRGGAADGFVVAVIPPNAAIALPVQSSSSWGTLADRVDSGDYFFQSVDPADLTDGAQTIGIMFICVSGA